MSKTVVGLFSTVAQAEQVKAQLLSNGYQSGHIKVVANDSDGSTTGSGTTIGEKISNFFHSMTGSDSNTEQQYTSGVSDGGALLAVTVEDSQAYETAALLKQHGARDIDAGSQSAATSGTPVYGESVGTMAAEGTAIPIIEEQLVVGKREVDRGGVRIYSHVVERPVEADVTLREEMINVERRPVDRAATEADFAAGSGSSIEVLATGEEAVVGKTSRVVEEVLVGKTSTQRTESIQDTVRKTEVNVEEIAGETVKNTVY